VGSQHEWGTYAFHFHILTGVICRLKLIVSERYQSISILKLRTLPVVLHSFCKCIFCVELHDKSVKPSLEVQELATLGTFFSCDLDRWSTTLLSKVVFQRHHAEQKQFPWRGIPKLFQSRDQTSYQGVPTPNFVGSPGNAVNTRTTGLVIGVCPFYLHDYASDIFVTSSSVGQRRRRLRLMQRRDRV